MRIALIGAQGQLGTDLAQRIDGVLPLTHADVDICDVDAVAEGLGTRQPDVVINTAAYNLVDRAEQDWESAFAVNAIGARNVARWCAAHDVRFVHISTDFVFGQDGARSTPYRETDCPGPVSVYGASKLTGEHLALAACPRALIVRTCGLYGVAATRAKGNFVTTMLRLGRERDELRIVSDQRCTPTFTSDLAAQIVSLIGVQAEGIVHVTNGGETTWYDFACEIFRLADVPVNVVPITSAEFGAAAARPPYSVLDCSHATRLTGQTLRPWSEALADYLQKIGELSAI